MAIDLSTLTPEQKKKLLKLAQLAKDGDVALVEHLLELEQKFDDTVAKIEAAVPDLPAILKNIKGVPGDDAHTPTDAELVALIKPLIPSVQDGNDGHTPTKAELLALIRPLIPKVKDGETPSDERLLRLIKPLIPAPLEAKEVDTQALLTQIQDNLPSLAARIRDGLELLPDQEKLKIEAIEGLQALLDELKKNSGSRHQVVASQRGQIKLYDLSSQLNGSLKVFTMPAFWRVISVQSTSTPNAFRPTVDYTVDASVPSITFTSQIDAASTLATGQSVLVMYAES